MSNIKPHIVTVELSLDGGKIIKKSVKFVATGCTLFFNAQHHLMRLSPKERAFFDYLCERMNVTTNALTIDLHLKNAFIQHIAKISNPKIVIKLNALGKYVQKLEDLGLILSSQHTALYIVNPKYVFKGTATARKKNLITLIEQRVKLKLPVSNLIDVAEEQFLKPN